MTDGTFIVETTGQAADLSELGSVLGKKTLPVFRGDMKYIATIGRSVDLKDDLTCGRVAYIESVLAIYVANARWVTGVGCRDGRINDFNVSVRSFPADKPFPSAISADDLENVESVFFEDETEWHRYPESLWVPE